MSGAVKPTPQQRRWLELLLAKGHAERPRFGAQAAFNCMRAGWTEWAFEARHNGEVMNAAEAARRYGSGWNGGATRAVGEMLTESGRLALSALSEGSGT